MLGGYILLQKSLLSILDVHTGPAGQYTQSPIVSVAHLMVEPRSIRMGVPSSAIMIFLPFSVVRQSPSQHSRRLDIPMRIRYQLSLHV